MKMKRVFSVLLSALIVSASVTALPLSAGAASVEQGVVDSVGFPTFYDGFQIDIINDDEAILYKYTYDNTNVTIPERIYDRKIIEIADYAFKDNKTVERITIPDTVKKIGSEVFSGCESLKKVDMPSTLSELGDYAFYGCSELNDVVIPNGVEVLEESVLACCNSLDNLVLPNSLKKIDLFAFAGCDSLESVVIPKNVKTIGTDAFYGCSSLTSVTLNEGLTEIGGAAFHSNHALKSINLPSTLKTISGHAFNYCENLETVTGGAAVTQIGADAFKNTKWDNVLKLNKGKATFIGKCLYKYVPKDSQLNGFNYKIKDGTTCVCSNAIANAGALNAVIVPVSVKYIGKDAFCENKENVNISDIYYMGTQDQWNMISRAMDEYDPNYYLDYVTKHYDYGHSVAAPKLTSLSNVNGGVKVSWNAVDGASKYKVFRKTDGTNWTALKTVTTTSYTDKTVVSGTRYYYTVRCVSPIDSSTYISSYNTAGLKKTYFDAPALKKATNGKSGVNVTWEAVDGASKYKVIRKTDSTSWKAIGYSTSTSYTDKTAVSGETYYYSVRCVDPANNASISSIEEPGLKKTFIAAPVLSKIVNSYKGVQINWQASDGAEKYRVYRLNDEGKWVKLADTTAVSYIDRTAESGKTYTYTVKCVNKEGTAAVSAFDTTGKKIKFIAAPVISSITKTSKSITIKWNKPEGSTNHYKIYWKNESGNWTPIATTNTTSFTDYDVEAGTKYTYTVRVISADEKTNLSGYNAGKSITF